MTALRPVTLADVDALDAWKRDPEVAGEFQWFGFMPTHALRGRVERGETISPAEGGTLAVVDDDGVLVGDISWRPSTYGPIPGTHAWNLGVLILPPHRGRGHGTAAQRLLARYLFDHTSANRVEADTDVRNVAEQRALEKAGFVREGLVRGAQYRAGEWHDLVLYSKLRGES